MQEGGGSGRGGHSIPGLTKAVPMNNDSPAVTQLLAEGSGSWDLTPITNLPRSTLPTWPGGLSLDV